MKQIEEYVDSVYRNVDGAKEEIQELKQEMHSHLLEAVYELKEKGISEEEAIKIAIEKFGDKKQIIKGLSEFFGVQKQFSRYLLMFSIFSLIVGAILFVNMQDKTKDFESEKYTITHDVLAVVGDSMEVSEEQKQKLLSIYREHHKHLNYLAVFNVKENPQTRDQLKGIEVTNQPTTIYPIDYKNATLVIGNEGEVPDKSVITPSDYDLGTVARESNGWIVQYEYSESYRDTIEKNNSVILHNYMDVYQLPILFLVVAGVLLIVWLFLKKHYRLLNRLIS